MNAMEIIHLCHEAAVQCRGIIRICLPSNYLHISFRHENLLNYSTPPTRSKIGLTDLGYGIDRSKFRWRQFSMRCGSLFGLT